VDNFTLRIKVQERLNKLASNDYDNLECWQIAEAFNKAQIEWVRRQLHGGNIYKEGDEQSTRRVDDLQILLKTESLNGNKRQGYFESLNLPADYLHFKRVAIKASSDCCSAKPFVVYQAEEADVDVLLKDHNTKPSFEWAETFFTMVGNRVRIYTNDEFIVENPSIMYYRIPRPVQFIGCSDITTGTVFTADQTCEFKDDVAEAIVDDACAILAGDIESMIQIQRNTQNADRNN
jgi:hypothetical protein